MHTKNVRMRPVPLWGRCTGSTDFTSRKKNTRKTNGATKQHSMRDQRQLWKSFSSSFASFEFTSHSLYHSNCSVPSMDFTIEEGDRGQMMVSALPSYARQRASKTLMPFFLAVLR